MRVQLQSLAFAIAGVSVLAGAVLSVLPALVIGLVALFYNSTGGILLLLGSLLSLLPHPPAAAQGAASLPVFPVLETGHAAILSRSVAGTVLCSIAFALLVTSRQRLRPVVWSTIIACCGLAAIAGGLVVGSALAPAIAFSGSQLAFRLRRQA